MDGYAPYDPYGLTGTGIKFDPPEDDEEGDDEESESEEDLDSDANVTVVAKAKRDTRIAR